MKKVFTIGLILLVPFFLSAQQKGNSQQEMQKQIELMRQEMQSQISALRDSIQMLKERLHDQQHKESDFGFFYNNPMPDKTLRDWSDIDKLLRERTYNETWNYSYPAPPSFDYRFMIPHGNTGDQLLWEELQIPQCPEISKQKHKHEWMKMLPFYHLFKS